MRQISAQIEPGDRHRDGDSENHSANKTDARQPAIERDMGPERQAICAENFEQSNSPRAHRETEQTADESQENGFDHYLPHNVRATCAHRPPNGHVFCTSTGPNEKKIY